MCKKIALCLMVLFNALTVLGQKEVLKFNRCLLYTSDAADE